jgi:hypothetical protein
MRRRTIRVALALATLALSACTPFVYGGVVVFGPAEGTAPVEAGKDQAAP